MFFIHMQNALFTSSARHSYSQSFFSFDAKYGSIVFTSQLPSKSVMPIYGPRFTVRYGPTPEHRTAFSAAAVEYLWLPSLSITTYPPDSKLTIAQYFESCAEKLPLHMTSHVSYLIITLVSEASSYP